jgi:hypothetical protein
MIYEEQPAGMKAYWASHRHKGIRLSMQIINQRKQDDGDGKCLCSLRNLNKQTALSVGLIHQRQKFSINLLAHNYKLLFAWAVEGSQGKKRL